MERDDFPNYLCDEYFSTLKDGYLDQHSQCWIVYPASELHEVAGKFLAIGSAGADGIEFGYRSGRDGLWAHMPIDAEFIRVAEDLPELIKGWRDGSIVLR